MFNSFQADLDQDLHHFLRRSKRIVDRHSHSTSPEKRQEHHAEDRPHRYDSMLEGQVNGQLPTGVDELQDQKGLEPSTNPHVEDLTYAAEIQDLKKRVQHLLTITEPGTSPSSEDSVATDSDGCSSFGNSSGSTGSREHMNGQGCPRNGASSSRARSGDTFRSSGDTGQENRIPHGGGSEGDKLVPRRKRQGGPNSECPNNGRHACVYRIGNPQSYSTHKKCYAHISQML